ncbi:MAG TPA: glycosyl hydrolase family 28 protein [bacterium]|nr:glycosyl hydrolase family 28 protein [bacterium]
MRLSIIITTVLLAYSSHLMDSQLRTEEPVRCYEPHPTAEESRRFRVEVNGEAVFTEQLPVREGDVSYDFPGAEKLSYHCARFSFEQEARVRVSVEGGFNQFTLRPGSAEIVPEVNGNTIALTMEEPGNLLLEVDSAWLYLFADSPEKEAPHPGSTGRKVVNIMDYEVDSTGKRLSTFAIQKAIIDVATGPDAGGVLYFPRGTYKTGTIRLYSGVTLYLTEGALLQASLDPEDFPLPFGVADGPPGRDYGYEYALIKIHHAENAGIRGRGTIDGGGAANGRLKIIHMENSENVVVEDVVVRNGDGWMCPILYCEKVLFRHVRVISPITSNTDGINPDSSVEVEIDGCFVCSGDDPLVVKATKHLPFTSEMGRQWKMWCSETTGWRCPEDCGTTGTGFWISRLPGGMRPSGGTPGGMK